MHKLWAWIRVRRGTRFCAREVRFNPTRLDEVSEPGSAIRSLLPRPWMEESRDGKYDGGGEALRVSRRVPGTAFLLEMFLTRKVTIYLRSKTALEDEGDHLRSQTAWGDQELHHAVAGGTRPPISGLSSLISSHECPSRHAFRLCSTAARARGFISFSYAAIASA